MHACGMMKIMHACGMMKPILFVQLHMPLASYVECVHTAQLCQLIQCRRQDAAC